MQVLMRSSLATVALLASCPAYALCFEPSFYDSAPSFYVFSKPNVPYCMTSGDGCDQWQINSYISQVEDYISKLSDYADEARGFANSAIGFANEAQEFAKCKADEVLTQHK